MTNPDIFDKNSKHILNLIKEYANIHSLAVACGSEYIFQNGDAQIDALNLVGDIFDTVTGV